MTTAIQTPTTKPSAKSQRGATVLFDAPGPKSRRRTFMYSVVAAGALLALVIWAVIRLYRSGEFSYAKWGPLLDPSNELFGDVWARLGDGIVRTLTAAVLAIALSLVIGVVLGAARISAGKVGRIPLIGLIELLRGLPVILAIYLTSRLADQLRIGFPLPGDNVLRFDLSVLPGGDLLWVLVLGLTAYNSVIIAEIVRSGVASLPKGQNEAALALGLTRGQSLRQILLPQAIRVMLPALISQLVVVVKDTSLIAVLGGYIELLKMSRLVVENLNNPIQVFTITAIIFIAVNYALTKLAEYVQRRLAARTSGST
jgi:glutamate transport system permease protein